MYIRWIFSVNYMYVTLKTTSFKYLNILYLDNLPVKQADLCTEIRFKYNLNYLISAIHSQTQR